MRLVAGDYLLTVNPVDGSEIERLPARGERAERPVRRTRRASAPRPARRPAARARRARPRPHCRSWSARRSANSWSGCSPAAAPSASPAPPAPAAPASSTLVAEDCEDLAPDGVVRLSGYRRTAADLLHDLFHAVYDAPQHRPDRRRTARPASARSARSSSSTTSSSAAPPSTNCSTRRPSAPSCSARRPEVPAPSAESAVEEVVLAGLDRAGGVELMERAVGRVLTEEEANWAGDLWFESEGLPLRFVQAGALLRQRDRLRAERRRRRRVRRLRGRPAAHRRRPDAVAEPATAEEVPLPSLGEAAAPAAAARLPAQRLRPRRPAASPSRSAARCRTRPICPPWSATPTPTPPSANWRGCGLVSPVGTRYRLAAGVQAQLEAAGYADDVEARARDRRPALRLVGRAPLGHPGAGRAPRPTPCSPPSPPLVPRHDPRRRGRGGAAVLLARTRRARLRRGAALGRLGARPARRRRRPPGIAGEVAEQRLLPPRAGRPRALRRRPRPGPRRAGGLHRPARGARRQARHRGGPPGPRPGRRPLAATYAGLLDGDRPARRRPDARPRGAAVARPRGVPAALARSSAAGSAATLVARRGAAAARRPAPPAPVCRGLARRNLVAAGAGALLVAVLGTVVTLGATSDNDADNPSDRVGRRPDRPAGGRRRRPSLGADTADGGRRHRHRRGDQPARPTPGPGRHDRHLGRPDPPTGSAAARPGRPAGRRHRTREAPVRHARAPTTTADVRAAKPLAVAVEPRRPPPSSPSGSPRRPPSPSASGHADSAAAPASASSLDVVLAGQRPVDAPPGPPGAVPARAGPPDQVI